MVLKNGCKKKKKRTLEEVAFIYIFSEFYQKIKIKAKFNDSGTVVDGGKGETHNRERARSTRW